MFNPTAHQANTTAVKARHREQAAQRHQTELDRLREHPLLPALTKRQLTAHATHKTNAWLSMIPLASHHLTLSALEFTDGLALRYGLPPSEAPTRCDGCGAAWSVGHAQSCGVGGLIIQRHNEIVDAWKGLADLVLPAGRLEPHVAAPSGKDLRGDLRYRGLFTPQRDAFLDVTVVATSAPSYLSVSHATLLDRAEKRKRKTYSDCCSKVNADFLPLASTTEGTMGLAAENLLSRLVHRYVERKPQQSVSVVKAWFRTQLQCAHVRAASMCMRGTRSRGGITRGEEWDATAMQEACVSREHA
jgi:hypothetical protein